MNALYFNIAVLFAVPFLTFLFVVGNVGLEKVEKAFFVFWSFWATFAFSLLAWGIFVAVHFITEYW